ncbi:hypothetical protein ACOSP7_014840 [Xanthoceras sorbifolium]
MEDRVHKLEENFETLLRSQNELLSEVAYKNGQRFGTTNSRGSKSRKQFNPHNKGDPTMWLCRAYKYFSLHEIAESDKVSLSSFYLEGDGQLWFQMLEQEQLYVTWEDFKNELQTRFDPNQFVDPFSMENPGRTSTNTTTQIKKMTADELSERRKKRLCFHCHDRYTPRHDCKKLFLIEASWEDEKGDVLMEEVLVCAIQAPKYNFYD